jgi:hypothetical protein
LKQWYHVDCFCELKNKPKSKIEITDSSQVGGFDSLSKDDQNVIASKLGPDFKIVSSNDKACEAIQSPASKNINNKDDLFHQFCELVQSVADEPSYNSKSAIIRKYINKVNQMLTSLKYRAID